MQEGFRRGPGSPEVCRGGGRSRNFGGIRAKNTKKPEVGQMAQGTAAGDFKVIGGGRGRLNLPTVSNTPAKGRRI